jgi:hypothetical protein
VGYDFLYMDSTVLTLFLLEAKLTLCQRELKVKDAVEELWVPAVHLDL